MRETSWAPSGPAAPAGPQAPAGAAQLVYPQKIFSTAPILRNTTKNLFRKNYIENFFENQKFSGCKKVFNAKFEKTLSFELTFHASLKLFFSETLLCDRPTMQKGCDGNSMSLTLCRDNSHLEVEFFSEQPKGGFSPERFHPQGTRFSRKSVPYIWKWLLP